ncbi:hypothetical protein AB1N83_013681 [Pleurotus pulmonarius]
MALCSNNLGKHRRMIFCLQTAEYIQQTWLHNEVNDYLLNVSLVACAGYGGASTSQGTLSRRQTNFEGKWKLIVMIFACDGLSSNKATVVARVVGMGSEGNSAEAERRGGSYPIPTTVPGRIATVNRIGSWRAEYPPFSSDNTESSTILSTRHVIPRCRK